MNKSEAAAYLAGVKRVEGAQTKAPTNIHVMSGEIVDKSENGVAFVQMDGLVFNEEDDQTIQIDTLGGLEEGDDVVILLSGEEGRGMVPLALGSVGSIDRIVLRVSEIEADYIKTAQLEAVQADIGTLQANDVTISGNLSAVSGRVDTLESDHVSVNELEAVQADIDTLEANTADIATLRADSAKVHNLTAEQLSAATGYISDLTTNNITAQNIVADHAAVGAIETTYARIDAANINTAAIRDAWVDKIMIQSGLLAHEGTVFTLDAIQVNASSIKAGTLDVDRLLVTGSDGEKYLMHIDATGATEYQKLDGGVIEDLTITADKIVAGAITAEKITTENIVGTGGWINLRSGTFAYMNATTGQGIAWDGSNLSIAGNVRIHNTTMTLEEVVETATNAQQTALDGAFLVLTSTNGQLFKNGSESTILQVAIFPNGGDRCDTIAQVRARFGSSAYIEWKWMHESSGEWGTLLSNDPHISRDGMWLTVTPEDVATKTTFSASLVVPD